MHEVKIKIFKPCGSAILDGASGIIAGVYAPKGFQMRLIKALHTNGQAVDTGRAVLEKSLGLRGAGVSLERYLSRGFKAEHGINM